MLCVVIRYPEQHNVDRQTSGDRGRSKEMNEVSLRQRIAVLVIAALLSVAGAFAASVVAADEAHAGFGKFYVQHRE